MEGHMIMEQDLEYSRTSLMCASKKEKFFLKTNLRVETPSYRSSYAYWKMVQDTSIEKIELVALGNLVINFELGCKVTSLNLWISVSLIAAMMKYVPKFPASAGMLVLYCGHGSSLTMLAGGFLALRDPKGSLASRLYLGFRRHRQRRLGVGVQ